jgi:predicted amidohydrolase YtcJ
MRILILLLLAASVAAAETAVHDITAYTSTTTGVREFNVLVFSDDGKILATGGESLLAEYPDAIRIDGKGRTVLPGLTDAHAHMYGLGFLSTSLDLMGTPSVTDAVRQIAEFAVSEPHSRWIQGRGWNQVLWPEKEFPSAADIDAVVSDRPVWLRRIDGHAGWANSATLEIAGINDDTPDPVGGPARTTFVTRI